MMSPLRICIRIICTLYCAFMILVFWIIYRDYYPSSCALDNKNCLQNYVAKTPDPLLKLWVYSSTSQSPNGSDLYPVWELDDFKANEGFTKDVTVRIPLGMHNNGRMFVHVFVTPVEEGGGRGEDSPFEADWVVNQTGIITHTSRQVPTHQNTSDSALEKQELVADVLLKSHWRSHLKLNMMTTDVNFDIGHTPIILENYIRPYEDQYLPIIVINDYIFRTKDLLPLNKTCKEMPLTITYTPASYGTLVMRMSMEAAWNKSSSDLSEKQSRTREAFINNVPFFIQTLIILLSCLLLLLLSFESDVSFWEERNTMGGLSTQTVVWSCVHTMVIFLKFMDREMSSFDLRVFATVFLSIPLTIEIWKLFKVFKARICWTEWRLVFDNAAVSDKERETQELDTQAMRCLSYVLYPAWVGMIIYTLMHNFHKSWYLLCLKTLADGFRCFGWLYNLPQVFINYKLKSVADLPWKVLIYRALCTFMLKVFFMTMIPFRVGNVFVPEDIIFVIYLFQRCLYNN